MQLADAEIKSQKTFDLSSVSKGKKIAKASLTVVEIPWKWDKIGSVDWILIFIFKSKIKVILTEFMYEMSCFSEF